MKPTMYLVSTFDAIKPNTFKFTWNGNQSFGNICRIKDNKTGTIVYEQSQTTMQLKHELAANTLTNGNLYNVSIATIDSENNISEYSESTLFYCYSTPSFYFNNVSLSQIIRNASYQVNMTYYQAEGEPLQSFDILLYDTSKNIIQTSNVQYDVDNITYLLKGLEDNQSYYLKATGLTLNGMEIETEFIYFSVNYVQPAIYSIMTLENILENGYIKIQSNVKSIDCYTNKDPIFINSEYVDLRNDVLTIDDDFSFENDFVINLSGYNISDGLIMQLFGSNGEINIYKRKGRFDKNNNVEKTYIELNGSIGFTGYVCFSKSIDNPLSTQLLSIWITKRNGLYSIDLKAGE